MIKTYMSTTMIRNLAKATVRLFVYDACKYTGKVTEEREVTYTGVTSWDIVDGDDAAEIEAHTDGSCIDDNHEYLVLHFEDGTTGTFRNSYVDMFLR